MCGIIGYAGHRPAVPVIIEGLRRLEYRGYDSAGVGFIQGRELKVIKAEGKLAALEEKLAHCPNTVAMNGIGHTRWATHGVPAERNAHPHIGGDNELAIIHNGIIENFQELKEGLLAKGYVFKSETDTEVLAHLIAEGRKHNPTLLEAFAWALRQAHGAYAVAVICPDEPGTILSARMSAPLILGVGVGEHFIASDIPAFLPYTRDVVFLEDGEIVRITDATWQVLSLDTLEPVQKEVQTVQWDMQAARKGGFKHFMLKEIYDQPKALRDTINPRIRNGRVVLDDVKLDEGYLRGLRRIYMVACGSASYVGNHAKYILERTTRIQVEPMLASEFRYSEPVLGDDTLVIIISQSGETADTLAALREANARGARTLAIVNVVGSAISKAAHDVIYTCAGPEIAVATTKAYSTQLAVIYLLAMYIGEKLGTLAPECYAAMLEGLQRLPDQVAQILVPENLAKIEEAAEAFSHNHDVFFIGRNLDSATCLEGSLKLKEIAYVHSEAYPAGELKHGPISLIEEETLVVALATVEKLFDKTMANVREVKARGAHVLGVTTEDFAGEIEKYVDRSLIVPKTHPLLQPSLTVIPLQAFAYYIALARGCDVDMPRNLAKSVTVE